MPGKVDRPPDIVAELRSMRRRLLELERTSGRLAAVAAVEDGTATLPNNTSDSFEFATVTIDTAGAFDAGQPDRLTVPYTGVYLVAASGSIDPSGTTTGFRNLTIAAEDSIGLTLPALASNGWDAALAVTAYLTAGSIVRLLGLQSSGGTLSASNGRLAIVWLGNKPGDA